MTAFVAFLTSVPFGRVVRYMRRVLRVRTVFESTRTSAQQLQFAYEQVVATARRTTARVKDPVSHTKSAEAQRRSACGKES